MIPTDQLLEEKGYAIVPQVFTEEEIAQLVAIVDTASQDKDSFRKSQDLFAIRNLLKEIPLLATALWTSRFTTQIAEVLGKDYFNTKAIYFDKPPLSNWSVAWHQDTTISIDKRLEINEYGPWTLKQGLVSVQPPLTVMQNIVAVRIHLDDCDQYNGALKVVPGSHRLGFIPDKEYLSLIPKAETCPVPKGGIMFMKPLLLHASQKSTSDSNRRVIHLEFASMELPMGLQWREREEMNAHDGIRD